MSVPAAVVRVEGLEVQCEVTRATIRHGRDDASSQPNADSATLELVGVMPAEAAIGATLEVLAGVAGLEVPRFAGRITDIAIGWDSVDIPVASIVAVGELADMGRRLIRAAYPEHLDGARVNAAIVAAGVSTDPARTDPGTLYVLGRDNVDTSTETALAVASAAAAAGNGFLWQATDGAVLYADADHRAYAVPVLTLEACDVPLGVTWAMGLEGLANDVAVAYGTASPQAEATATDPASVAELGPYSARLATILRDAAEAQARARLIVTRQAWPAWVMAGLGFPLEFLGLELTADLLGLEVHDLITVTGLPAGSPATAAHLFVEGWTETLAAGSWVLELAVSDYCRTAPAPEWDELSPAHTWDSVTAELTWDGATCLPPPVPEGRWSDVPASDRWNTIAPAVTWDTWT